MEKVTKRVRFEQIQTLLALAEKNGIDEEGEFDFEALQDFCANEIALLDKKAAKAKERAVAKQEEADELQVVVESLLTNEPQTRDEITAQIEGEDVSVAKVGARLTKLVKAGIAAKTEVTVGEKGKTRKIMAYALVNA